jgi:hypothetical protein
MRVLLSVFHALMARIVQAVVHSGLIALLEPGAELLLLI